MLQLNLITPKTGRFEFVLNNAAGKKILTRHFEVNQKSSIFNVDMPVIGPRYIYMYRGKFNESFVPGIRGKIQ